MHARPLRMRVRALRMCVGAYLCASVHARPLRMRARSPFAHMRKRLPLRVRALQASCPCHLQDEAHRQGHRQVP
eukprot:510867-Pleurochrysis_carterae.AAC.1